MVRRPGVKRLFRFPFRTAKELRDEIAEEFQFHLDMRIETLVAAGLSEADARAQALREFGDRPRSADAAVRHQERLERRSRLTRALGETGQLWPQCRITARVLAHNWRLTTVMIVTIAVAVGAATTAMSFVSPILLKALPFREADRLYRIEASDAKGQPIAISVPTFLDWQSRLRRARLAAYTFLDFSVTGGDAPASILAARVTPAFFDTLGLQLSLGRAFADDDHRVGGPRSVILTHPFWQSRYGGDHTIIGRTIDLSGPSFLPDASGEYRVIGVLSPDFWLFYERLEIVIPLRLSPEQMTRRDRPAIETVLATLAPGHGGDTLNGELASVVQGLSSAYGAAEPVARATAVQAQAAHYREYRPRLLLVLVLAILMFALAILNVAAMLIALAVTRQREFSMRAALGASRGVLLRQTLLEGMLLATVGGTFGVLLGLGANLMFRAVVPSALVSLIPGETAAISVDAPVVAAIAGAVLLMGVLCAMVTFTATGGVREASTLRDASRGTTEAPTYGRLRHVTVATQLALAVGLVVTTSVLSVSLVRLQSVDLGMSADRLIGYWINLDPRRYVSATERRALFERILDSVGSLAGAETVSGIDHPVTQDRQKIRVVAGDRTATRDSQPSEVYVRAISPAYFRTMRVPLLEGRDFAGTDAETTQPVAIISRSLADRLWPDGDSIGQQVRPGGADSREPSLTVVGIAADVRRVPHEPPMAILYRPLRQNTPAWLYVMVRTTTDSIDITRDVRQAVLSIDPRQPVEGPYIMAKWVSDMTAALRFVVLIGVSFSLLAVLLAFAGVYALTADLSHRAARDIGIRKALGATTSEIIGLYVRRSARSTTPALAVGAFIGIAVIRVLASRFDDVDSPQVWIGLVVVAFFAGLVGLATFLASRSAAHANPSITMRME